MRLGIVSAGADREGAVIELIDWLLAAVAMDDPVQLVYLRASRAWLLDAEAPPAAARRARSLLLFGMPGIAVCDDAPLPAGRDYVYWDHGRVQQALLTANEVLHV